MLDASFTLILVASMAGYLYVMTFPDLFDSIDDTLIRWERWLWTLSWSRLGVYCLAAIAFLVWFYRAYQILPSLGVVGLKNTPQGAVGCWLIPILNVFRPLAYTREIWRASDPAHATDTDDSWSHAPVHWILGTWWTLWLVSTVSGVITRRLPGASYEQQRFALLAMMASEVLRVIDALLAVWIVASINRRQSKRLQLRREAEAITTGDAFAT